MRNGQPRRTILEVLLAGLFVVVLFARPHAGDPSPTTPDKRAVFEENYQQWKAYCQSVGWSGDFMLRLNSPYYRAIVDLGPQALPWIVEKRKNDPTFFWIASAWLDIARIHPVPGIYPWTSENMIHWWEGGQKQANERFNAVYEKWKEAKERGAAEDAAKLQKTMRALGIAALPRLTEKVKGGDDDLLPIILDLTKGAAAVTGDTPEKKRAALGAWWEKDKAKWLLPFPDQEKPVQPAPPSPAQPPAEQPVAASPPK